MARKSSTQPKPVGNGAASRGRPPLTPKTEAARWIRQTGRTVQGTADEMQRRAPELGLPASLAPRPKTLLDAVNGRHTPSPPTMLLLEYISGGKVGLREWVRDLYLEH